MNKKTSKKDLILSAAEELFSEQGFGHISINQIAEHAGVTKSLIFHHFESKQQLWDVVKDNMFNTYVMGQLDLFKSIEDPIELIRQSIRGYFDFLQQHPRMARIFTWAHLENDENSGELDKPLINGGTDLIRDAQEKGLIRKDIDPVAIIMTFVSVINQYYVAQCHFEIWEKSFYTNPDLFVESLTNIIIKGIQL
ncbi:TetR/AcrR family transcriptional regulator [Marinicella sp. W31]|uniref:TetR/AcrR family transcriptional regulator n=1 Tax=Marinicella sp. W31 TaxID=3023713 RepID=UPI0037570474